ncbi:MAG: hypothetical protein QW778_02955 [Candidatus Micrarchaeaceae archaeon]
MSSNLMALLERINAKTEEVKPVEKPFESPYLRVLVERLEAVEWRREMLQKTLERLCMLSEELDLCRHIQKCRNCQFELSLDVIRYGGNHSGIWYISILDGDFLPEVFPDCPPVENYNMGSYWTGENHAEAVRFIVDRARWAEPIIEEELYTLIDFYLALENWDLKSPLPPFTSNEELFSWGML